MLWTNETAQQATGGKAQGTWAASRVVIDSRIVQPGDLYVAIVGERVDGHTFVAEAFARGAVGAVVSTIPEGAGNYVLVDDTLEALAAMGRFARARSNAKIVGVTGSVGKTSTKEMLKIALSAHGKTYATMGNYNNHIGTPLNLANFPPESAFGVFEMGMNHAGEIRHLVEMVRPHVAIITTVEAVHLEFFDSVQGIADAKAEIFEHTQNPSPLEGGRLGGGYSLSDVHPHPNPPPSRGRENCGIAILNADNSYHNYLAEKARAQGIFDIRSFGEKVGVHAQLISYAPTMQGAELVAKLGAEILSFAIGATGKHFAKTAVCALLAAEALGLPLPKTAAALVDFAESDGRGKVLPIKVSGGNAWLIDDAYNASPASMVAAIAKACEVWQLQGKKGRKIAALGEMRELGETAPALHAGLAEALVAHGFELVFTAWPLMEHLAAALPEKLRAAHVSNAAELLPHLQKTLQADDVLLVKGSHGSKMYEVANSLIG